MATGQDAAFYIDIEDASGGKLGAGPIVSASSWTCERRMDQAGRWSFTAPLSDVRVAGATVRRYAHIYAWVAGLSGAGSFQWVGGGPIDAISTRVDEAGTVVATVAGDDLLRELAWRSVGNLEISNGAGGGLTHAAAVALLGALAPSGWSLSADASPPYNSIYGTFGGEALLAALGTVAERSRSHFYLSGRRAVTFGSSWAASGVRLVQGRPDLGSGQAAITALQIDKSSYDLYSRVIPLGSGQSRAALTLRATSRVAGAGYTLDKSSNYLRADAVESAYGRAERTVLFRDIGPISSSAADVQSAANALYDAALYWLDRHSAPITSYRVAAAECPVLVHPLQTVRVEWADAGQGLSINQDLYVLGVTWAGNADGVRTAALTVADLPLWPADDAQALVDLAAQGTIYQAHPQLNANSYVIAYTKHLDDQQANPAEFRFRFDAEVVQLNRVTFDFQLLPLESTVRSVASSSTTSSAETGHTHSVTVGNHSHSVTIGNHAHGVDVPDHEHAVSLVPHTHSVSVANHQHQVSWSHSHSITISHTHGVTLPGHTHTVPEHTHTVTAAHTHAVGVGNHYHDMGDITQHTHAYGIGNSNTGFVSSFGLSYGAWTGNIVQGVSNVTSGQALSTDITSSKILATSLVVNSTTATTDDGGTRSFTTDSAGSTSTNTTSAGSATITSGDAVAGIGIYATALGGSASVTSAAGGGTTATSSSGGGTTATSAAGSSHSHTVTAAIATTYGVYRDDAGNLFALNDLEYSLDGTTWYGLAVGVNGFTNLGDGWTRIDLSGLVMDGTTLRPLSNNNRLQMRRKTTGATGKRATIDAQLTVRNIIQAIAYTG